MSTKLKVLTNSWASLVTDRFLLCHQNSQFLPVWTLRDLSSGIKKKKKIPRWHCDPASYPEACEHGRKLHLKSALYSQNWQPEKMEGAILPISLPCHPQPADYTGCGCGQRHCLWHSVLPLDSQPQLCDLGCLCVSHYHLCSVLLGSGVS